MAKARAKRSVRTEQVPDFVRTADYREPSLLATSPATLKAHEDRRGRGVVVPPSVKLFGMVKLSAKDILNLRVDSRYQREEVTEEVNSLITIMQGGGIVPDPISVAERLYGDRGRYIVDGQQRWWAHVDLGRPMNAVVYRVESLDDEIALFHALNTSKAIGTKHRLRSRPGPLGEVLRKLNEDPHSPLYAQVHWGTSGTVKIAAPILLRGFRALLTNATSAGGVENSAQMFDKAYQTHPRLADQFIHGYATLVARIFNEQRLTVNAAIALGKLCYADWTRHGAVRLPSDAQINRLRRVDWQGLTPTKSTKWLPVVLANMTNVWPVNVVKETRTDIARRQWESKPAPKSTTGETHG